MQTKIVETDELLALSDQGLGIREIARRVGISPQAVSKRLSRFKQSEPPESLQHLTAKEVKFISELATGKTQTDAAMAAFDCTTRESAKVIGSRLMKETEINTALVDLMAQEGISKRTRVARMKEHILGVDSAASCKMLDLSFKLDGSLVERIDVGISTDLIRELIQSLPDSLPPVIDITPTAE